jgi:CRP-like cAMP-binding protein
MNQFESTEIAHANKILLLESSPWAHDLNASQLTILSEYFNYYSIPAKTAVMQEGERNEFFCLICEGSVDILKDNMAGESKFVQKFGPGKTFGEMSFFDNTPCSATVVTREPVYLLSISQSAFRNLCQKSPSIALQLTLNLMSHLSHRLRQTTGKLIDLL